MAIQYQQAICVLQSDNGGKYVNVPMKEFLTTHGIHHQTLCSYTPQHNGFAECKNRQLIEVVCAYLFGMNMSRAY